MNYRKPTPINGCPVVQGNYYFFFTSNSGVGTAFSSDVLVSSIENASLENKSSPENKTKGRIWTIYLTNFGGQA